MTGSIALAWLAAALSLGLAACGARGTSAESSPRTAVRALALERVPTPLTARPGTYVLETPARGVLVGRFTFDNACRIPPAGGEHQLVGDTLRIVISWPPGDPGRACPDAVIPEAYRFRVERLPAGDLHVVLLDHPHGREPRESRAFPPRRVVIR